MWGMPGVGPTCILTQVYLDSLLYTHLQFSLSMRYCCVRFSTAAVVSTAIVAPTTVYCQRATNSPTFVVTHHTLLFVEPVSFLSIQQSSPPKFYTGRQNTKNVTTALALQRPHWEGIEGVNFSAGKRLQTVWRQAEMRTPTCCSKASQQGMR